MTRTAGSRAILIQRIFFQYVLTIIIIMVTFQAIIGIHVNRMGKINPGSRFFMTVGRVVD